jgi:hypothetical protein
MRPGMRFGLSEIEKRDVWSRWKAGQTLHEIAVITISRILRSALCYCPAAVSLLLFVAARG